MAFVWNDELSAPPPIVPIPVADGEMSFEQKEVANTVIVHPIYGVGTLSQNVSSDDFDIIYSLPTFNVKDLHVTHLESNTVTVLFHATINTANIGAATINTANIVNATIANGRMGVNPTSNLQIATKEYVDALAANSVPLGGNLQLLIQAAGDLLVGVSDNTAARLPIGSNNGGVLVADSSQTTGVRWTTRSVGPSATHRGLFIGTAFDEIGRNTSARIVSVDEIIMDDGLSVRTGWNGLTANILSNVATSGVGFLDTGVVLANTCYEVWAIRSTANGAQGLILHRAVDRFVDANSSKNTSGLTGLRKIRHEHGSGLLSCVNLAQSFMSTKSGPLTGFECSIFRTGNPIGNAWVSVQSNTASGNPSGVYLARSRNINVQRISTFSGPPSRIRFIFDTCADVVSGDSYWAVIEGDYPTSHFPSDNHLTLAGVSSGVTSYADGTAKNFLSNTNTWVVANAAGFNPAGPPNLYFRTFVEANNTDLLMPAGYDQKCLLSYLFTDTNPTGGTPRAREYRQRDHTMTMTYQYSWAALYSTGTGFTIPFAGAEQPYATGSVSGLHVVNLSGYVPPVPCLVSFRHYGFSSGLLAGYGALDTTDLIDGQLSSRPMVYSKGGVIANLIGTADGTLTLGPVFVEQQAIMLFNPSTGTNIYVAEVEF